MEGSYFKGRQLVIATQHQKEAVIAPLCEAALGVNCLVPSNLNTDQLGTFSGEIERVLDPLESARQKCQLAMDLMGLDLAIASEGSFGQHPNFFFSQADDELVVLIDRKNNIEIVGRKLSTNTNFGGQKATSLQEANAIATSFQFGSHALILRHQKDGTNPIYKGITQPTDFEEKVAHILAENGSVWIETDMRAMHNPTRMSVIAEATQNLLKKAQSLCPQCHFPGYSVVKATTGLPCEACGLPTKSILVHQYQCAHCQHEALKKYPLGKTTESAQFCDFCNP